jgi:hypothetical protein
LVGRTIRWTSIRIFGARKNGVVVVIEKWDRFEKRMVYSKITKGKDGFLQKGDP